MFESVQFSLPPPHPPFLHRGKFLAFRRYIYIYIYIDVCNLLILGIYIYITNKLSYSTLIVINRTPRNPATSSQLTRGREGRCHHHSAPHHHHHSTSHLQQTSVGKVNKYFCLQCSYTLTHKETHTHLHTQGHTYTHTYIHKDTPTHLQRW